MVAASHSAVAPEAADMEGKRRVSEPSPGENIFGCRHDARMFQRRDYPPANLVQIVTVWPDSLINAHEVV
jgi:hypothetical protein